MLVSVIAVVCAWPCWATQVDHDAWFAAVARGDAGRVRALVAAEPRYAEARDAGGRTALHYACAMGEAEMASVLLRAGSAVDARDGRGDTGLHLAARACNETMIKALLDAGAAVRAANHQGQTPAHQLVDSLRSPRAKQVDCSACLGLLLKAGTDVNQADESGVTLVHAAAGAGSADVLNVLAEAGAELKCRDALGRTPLHYAAFGNHVPVIGWLVDRGAQVDARSDDDGDTPLHSACRRFRVEAVEALLDRGAGADARNRHGRTALHILAEQPPHAAETESRRVQAARRLLEHGADPRLTDARGLSASAVAQRSGFGELARTLSRAD